MQSPNRLFTALFAVLALASTALTSTTSTTTAQARPARPVRVYVTLPVVTPYWDSNIVPRYRYRPEDDRVDPCGGPVIPVIREGAQEAPIPLWLWKAWGFPIVHGVSWPCAGSMRH
jgi:hypothetical protein